MGTVFAGVREGLRRSDPAAKGGAPRQEIAAVTSRSVLFVSTLLVLVVSLGGCKLIPGKKAPQAAPGAAAPAPAPPPVPVSVMVQTSATVNPGENGRPLPVVVRLYQLKSDAAFRAASYDRLYEDDKGTLGSDLVGERFSVTLRPSDQTVHTLEVGADVRFIGIAAFYRQYDNANVQWKTWIPTPVKGSVSVMVDKSSVSFTTK